MTTRGTTNGNARGSANPDYTAEELGDYMAPLDVFDVFRLSVLTIDRIVSGCQGGTYRRNNIRPSCGACNSETGGAVRGKP